MDIDFECTMCGRCCHDLRLPLTVTEALAWLERGNDVQILCDASPWPEEPPQQNLVAAHRRRRSFAAVSGSLSARVVVILAGAYDGACPNLLPDMRCNIYEQRPLVCRIYPAEVSPFIELLPGQKACPPDAWKTGLSPLLRSGKLVDSDTARLVQKLRDVDARDISIKQSVCQLLGVDSAAVWNEGFVVYSPDRVDLATALHRAINEPTMPTVQPWHFVSDRQVTVEALLSVGASSTLVTADMTASFEYLGF
ncbi:YkgJ family cysteine cluster protein [Paraburkholderia hospita]|uniref:YkgJ family cysteine cluster protein n=1 Tax=Paraburkholderia hospita TaxID=169430 RepID=UPI000B34323B|nr:YkgJ family cysteine cluster protein [Paraburkholderia hospita]OUL94324.1 zinc/iron-chelating domain-containing protein [Paraburkholderia hospita]